MTSILPASIQAMRSGVFTRMATPTLPLIQLTESIGYRTPHNLSMLAEISPSSSTAHAQPALHPREDGHDQAGNTSAYRFAGALQRLRLPRVVPFLCRTGMARVRRGH